MKVNSLSLPVLRFAMCLAVLLITEPIVAASNENAGGAAFTPQEGQEGKDVVWVPTSQRLVDKMLDLAKVTSKDYVIDLGSGDGRTVIAAAKRGARAVGVEYNPEMVELSKMNAAKAGVEERAKFVQADLFKMDLSRATVITMFLLPEINLKLRPKILALRPGTRIVSNTFDMEQWKADQTAEVTAECNYYCTAHLWIVPAHAEGTWELPQGDLVLKQQFQQLSGTLQTGKRRLPVSGKLVGNRLVIQAGELRFSGDVQGESITGVVSKRWSARRKKTPATIGGN